MPVNQGTRPTDMIASQIVQNDPGDATYLDLVHLPSSVLAWLFTRPPAQTNTCAMIAKIAPDQIVSGSTLRHDPNVLVLTTRSGSKLYVYPTGGIGCDGLPVDMTPEAILGVIGGGMSAPTVDPMMTNVVAMPDVESPLDLMAPEVSTQVEPELSTIRTGDIAEEPVVGMEVEKSDIDKWIDSLEMTLNPREQAQVQTTVLDSVGNSSPIRSERRKRK